MDKTAWHYHKSIFVQYPKLNQWANPINSWKNKWNLTHDGEVTGERFLGSSTVFVFTTDLWHFSQFLMWNLVICAIVFYQPMFEIYNDLVTNLIHFVIFKITFSSIFELFFRIILKKR